MNDIEKVIQEMRDRKVNNGKHNSDTLLNWADRLEKASADPSEVERLRAEVEQVRNSTPFQHGYRFVRGSDVREIDRIGQQLAEAQALLREADFQIARNQELRGKIAALLSAKPIDGAKS